MKYSGVEWIGEIPDKWEVRSVRECLFERNEKNDKLEEKTILSLSAKDGVTLYDGNNHSGNKPREDLSGYKIVKVNDIVANSMNILSGSVGLSKYNGVVSPVYYIYHIRNSKDNIRYFNYIFQCNEFQKNLRRLGKGILIRETEDGKLNTIRTKVPSYQLSIEKLPYPNENTQQRIVEFLDEKISKIDSLIQNQEKQISVLEEEKVSFITKTIEEGIDNELTNSPIKTVSKMPIEWKCTKLLNLLEMKVTDGPHETPELFPEGIPFVSAEAIKNWTIDFNYIRGFISKEFYDYCCLKYIPRKNDIYVVKSGASTGKLGIVDTDKVFTIWSPLAVVRVDEKKAFYKFVFYALYSRGFQKQIQLGWSFGTQQNLGMRTLETLKIQYPASVDEQKKIASYIDSRVEKIDRLIKIKQEKIEKLQEYKKSLIYEYVTGKKEV